MRPLGVCHMRGGIGPEGSEKIYALNIMKCKVFASM